MDHRQDACRQPCVARIARDRHKILLKFAHIVSAWPVLCRNPGQQFFRRVVIRIRFPWHHDRLHHLVNHSKGCRNVGERKLPRIGALMNGCEDPAEVPYHRRVERVIALLPIKLLEIGFDGVRRE